MKLYSTELLGLSASLANYPLRETQSARANARSRACGSSLTMGLQLDECETIADVGLQVTACAVGQASAAVFANAASGQDRASIQSAFSQIEAWLNGEGDLPNWPGFAALAPAREHAGRHGALLLPWRAAISALSSEHCPS